VKGFRVEQGDVLLSVQMVLTREEEARRRQIARGGPHPAVQRGAPAPSPSSRPQAVRPSVQPGPVRPAAVRPAAVKPAEVQPVRARPAVSAPAPVPTRQRPRPAGPPAMVDPLTGIGTMHALRRDLMLEQAWPVGTRKAPVIIALEIAPLDQIRVDMGPEAGDRVLKCLVEVAPFALRTQDRIYRSGRNQLTLMLPGTDGLDAESARNALEVGLQRRLDGCGYPEVRLAARKLDPVALAS
jgi:hypothetical protein